MNTEDLLINSLSEKYHQSYVDARQNQGMACLTDYREWLAKNSELEKLIARNNTDTWENSEYNPANYPDWNSLDEQTAFQRLTQGKQEYLADSEELERQIKELEALIKMS